METWKDPTTALSLRFLGGDGRNAAFIVWKNVDAYAPNL